MLLHEVQQYYAGGAWQTSRRLGQEMSAMKAPMDQLHATLRF